MPSYHPSAYEKLTPHELTREDVGNEYCACSMCGFPMYAGETVMYDSDDDPFCSRKCYAELQAWLAPLQPLPQEEPCS